MLPIIVSGGSYPDNWKTIQDKYQENFIRFDTANLSIIDWDNEKVIDTITYISPDIQRNPSMMFKVCDLTPDSIITVTNSEIVEFDRKTHKVIKTVSDVSFNDLHAVKKINGFYYLVNTGLEILQVINENGLIVEEINMATTSTWDKFSRAADYRKIGSTKPHEMHINNVFNVEDDIFVTRLSLKHAININNERDIFDIEVGLPHDGVVYNQKVYFTTTNGHIIIFDAYTRKKISVIDVNQLLSQDGYKPDGWCRGILPLSEDKILVGYTKLRHTKFKEFLSWTKNLGSVPAPTRIIEIDVSTNSITKEMIFPGDKGFAIFSILRL